MSAGHGASAAHANSSTADIGLREEGLDRAADLAAQDPYPNPTPLTRAATRVLLENAFHGRRPAA
jgi:maleylacetate reductase